MAGGGSAEPQEGGGGGQNVFGESTIQSVDLNLTALMDILSNLLFFLLASFGATIVMSINATVPVQSADKSDVADTKQTVTVNLKVSKEGFEVTAVGTAQTEEELAPLRRVLPVHGDQFDYEGLGAHLVKIKEAYPKSDTVIMTPESGVNYEVMIRAMDTAREREVKAGSGVHMVRLFPTVVVSTVVK
jgi:biopolymer transport protein ExbD